MPELTIRPARPQELGLVLDILDEAAKWLADRGIEQWPVSFSDDDTWRTERIRAYIDKGMTYLVRNADGLPVATFTLSRHADPQFAHGWPGGTKLGGYLFRMAVARSAAGHDLGGQLIDWAAHEVARWGRPWLRIDVHRKNPTLQSYYQRHGFHYIGEVTAPDLSVPGRIRGSGTLMQRPTPAHGTAAQPSSTRP